MDKGSALAACNLASQLVSAGFVKRAEMVLSSFSDYSGFESNKASTDGELAQAKKNLEDRKKSIRSKTTTNFDAFQTALSELEAWFYSDEKRPESLRYHNTDPELDLIVDQNFASASFSLEGVRFEGKLARNGIVYEGLIGQVGSTILSSVHRRMLLLPAPGHDISAVIFPPSSSGNLLVLRVKPTP
jgi:hypothetical protein